MGVVRTIPRRVHRRSVWKNWRNRTPRHVLRELQKVGSLLFQSASSLYNIIRHLRPRRVPILGPLGLIEGRSGEVESRIKRPPDAEHIVPLKIEYGFGYIIKRSPYTPYSIYLRGTITLDYKAAQTPCANHLCLRNVLVRDLFRLLRHTCLYVGVILGSGPRFDYPEMCMTICSNYEQGHGLRFSEATTSVVMVRVRVGCWDRPTTSTLSRASL